MGLLFDANFLALSSAVAVETAMLRSLVRDVLWLKGLQQTGETATDRDGPPVGTLVPRFRARLLDSTEMLADTDLRGQPIMLLFLSSTDMRTLGDDLFAATIYGLQTKSDGRLCIICGAGERDCRAFRDR